MKEHPQSSNASTGTVFQPNEGRVLQVLGETITCKFHPHQNEGARFFELVSTANSGAPMHTHPWDEGFYVLTGEVEVYINQQTILATPGAFISIPAGIAHTYAVRSPQARLLYWVSNHLAAAFLEEMAQSAAELSRHPEQMMSLCQKHLLLPAPPIASGIIVHDIE
jgi:quercetin dioxygenase-like cupin family protein